MMKNKMKIFNTKLNVITKPRPRFAKGHAYMPAAYTKRKKELSADFASQDISDPFKGPVTILIKIFTNNKRRADVEGLFGCIADSLEGIAYYDDIQIVSLEAHHRKTGHLMEPMVYIEVHEHIQNLIDGYVDKVSKKIKS
jgi:Holliday junction resolvase RusA-like endonuclease